MEQANKKVAVITGASRGIGRAIALELASLGYNLVLSYINSDELVKSLEDELKQYPLDYILVKADVGTKQGRELIVHKTIEKFKSLHVLINNAGIYKRASFKDLAEEDYDKTLEVNLKAPIFLTQEFLPYFQESSSIIFLSSINAFTGSSQGLDYVISKLGLNGVTKSLAAELAPKIRVNAIAPGNIDTDMINSDTSEKRQERINATPMKRVGKPEDIAFAVKYLVSHEASFITGQVIHVNGGKLML